MLADRGSQPGLLAHALLALLSILVLFTAIHTREVHGTAALYASLARTIADSGDPLAVFTGSEAYLLKPPLLLWISAGFIKIFGPTSFAATLATRLSGLLVVLLTYALARRLYGSTVAWCAALVLVSNSTFHHYATTIRMDALLMVGVLLSVLAWLYGRYRFAPFVFFLGLSIAILTKGPPGLLPLALLPVHGLMTRPALAPRRYWLAGSLVLAFPVAWYWFLIDANGARVWLELAADINRGSHITASEHFYSALDAYLVKPFLRFWPGLPFMLYGIYISIRRLRAGETHTRADAFLLLSWVLVVVVASVAKPEHDIRYLFMALPALAILGGVSVTRCLSGRAWLWLYGVLASLCLVLIIFGHRFEPDDRPQLDEIRIALDEVLERNSPVVFVGTNPGAPPGPRRQHNDVDWAHYYLGRPAAVRMFKRADAAELSGHPLLLVSRHVRSDDAYERLEVEELIAAEEVSLVRPRGFSSQTQP